MGLPFASKSSVIGARIPSAARVAITTQERGRRVARPPLLMYRSRGRVGTRSTPAPGRRSVQLEPDTPATHQRLVEPRGCLAAARAADPVVRDFRRIHADVADPFDTVIEPDVDRVAVVDVDDGHFPHRRQRRQHGHRHRDREENCREGKPVPSHEPTITPQRPVVNVQRPW
jgi:hypothetical protein